MPHLEKDYVVIEYDGSLDAAKLRWRGFVDGEKFREALNEGLVLVEQESADNWFADLRELETVAEEDQQWSNEEWFPRAIDAGLKNMAIVQPESVVAEMSVDNIIQEVDGADLVTHYFDDPDDAREWLAGQ
jgi:hypothetical protein